ncbi:MAG: PorV/PorQ family protein [Bacteroidetes bacterium]|nr:PorV/PorQ family protein [Bacteroidota bacterium]
MIHFNRLFSSWFRMRLLFIILLVSICSFSKTFAGGQDRAGTAAAPELRIPVGGQYLALNGSAVAYASGLEAIYWNPAGVNLTETNASAIFSFRQYIADMDMSYAALSGNFGDFGTIAVSFRSLNIGDISVTTIEQPDGTGEIISPTYFVLGLTYSRLLSDRISIGINFNIINESWGGVSANGFGVDVGVQYRDLFTPGLALGIVVKNLGGSMKYEGSALFLQADDPTSGRGNTFYQVAAASFELPSEFSLGISYTRALNEENTISFSSAFVNNNFAYDDYKFGVEYSYRDILFLRGGYLFSDGSKDERPNIFEDYTLGLGLNLKEFASVDVSLDYAFVPVQFFDSNHTFSIRVNF